MKCLLICVKPIRLEITITYGEIHIALEEAGSEASKVFLAELTGRDDLPVSELLWEALDRLPSTGSIMGRRNMFALKCIGWLKDEVPDSHPRKVEINRRWGEMQSRVPE